MSEIQNAEVAARLSEAGKLLAEQGANPYRARAYQRAAELLLSLPRPVAELVHAEGTQGLEKLPGIGSGLARAIRDIVHTGRLPMVDRLRGESDPVALLASIPGIGERTADRLHHDLGIHTLEQLEQAAHEGRLAGLGLGEKRLAGIRDCLAQRLGSARHAITPPGADEPSVAEVLAVDREYREKAAAGQLHRITPRRFNPKRQAWLPLLHTHRGERHYTALYSNTARAHELGATNDWVVIYYADGEEREHQCTVITAHRGALSGRRIIRGREEECAKYYARTGGLEVAEVIDPFL